MYIPTPYFKSVPYFGDLTLDYIFVKDKSPLLFTCIANNNMYLCLCYDNRIEQKWAISPIDVEMLRKMVYDEIPICKAFKPENSLGCIVTWSPDDKHEKYNMIPCEQFADEDLPDNDFYLEDEEAITYYNAVKNRLEQKEMVDSEKNISIIDIEKLRKKQKKTEETQNPQKDPETIKLSREELISALSSYFQTETGSCDAYTLMRDKSGFAAGTVTIEDFQEFDEDNIVDIADYIFKKYNSSERRQKS